MIQLDGEGPLYRQIYRAFRSEILSRRLRPGARLPSTRALRGELGVSRNVVLLAYEQLIAEGYAEARTGSGTVVAPSVPDDWVARLAPTSDGGAIGLPAPTVRHARAVERVFSATGRRPVRWNFDPPPPRYDFRPGRPAFGDFPHELWCRLVGRRARRATRRDLDYGPPEGRAELREALADRLRRLRGLDASPEQIVVVNGSQQALDLVCRALLDPGDRVLVEDPQYLGARWTFVAAGAELVPAPVDDEGIRVPIVRRRTRSPRLAYVTPSHQFPTGVVLPLARRLALLDWAARADAFVVEDDYDSEYRYEGPPLQALAGLDGAERVIYVGTFSKLMFPAIRLGYLVLPKALVAPVLALKAITDTGSATLTQLALADFIAEGHFERHLRRACARNALRREALLDALGEHFGDRAEVSGAATGLHVLVWIRGKDGQPIRSIGRKAAAGGVALYPVAPYYLEPPARSGVLLGYAPLAETQIREGIARLAEALGKR